MRSVLGLASALLLAACATTPPSVGGTWRAADVNGLPVTGARPLTLTLGPDGRASGDAGCNSFSGTYAFRSRDRIDLGPLARTEMACEPRQVMEQEARYLSILEAAESYSRYGDGSLSIIAPDGRAIRFRRGG